MIGRSIPFANLSFRREQDAREYPATIELGLKKDCSFLPGLTPARKSHLFWTGSLGCSTACSFLLWQSRSGRRCTFAATSKAWAYKTATDALKNCFHSS